MSTVLRAGEREYRERLRKKDLEIAEQLDKIEVRIGRNNNYSECRKSSVVQNHTKKGLGGNLDHYIVHLQEERFGNIFREL